MFALSAMQKITFATVWTGITLAFAFAPPPLGSIMNFRYSYFNEMMNVPGSQNRKRLQLVAGKETRRGEPRSCPRRSCPCRVSRIRSIKTQLTDAGGHGAADCQLLGARRD